MKVKELVAMLQSADLEADVVIMDNGSALKTASADESLAYNCGQPDAIEFYLVTKEWDEEEWE